jgi:hypothetical protein
MEGFDLQRTEHVQHDTGLILHGILKALRPPAPAEPDEIDGGERELIEGRIIEGAAEVLLRGAEAVYEGERRAAAPPAMGAGDGESAA